MRRVICDCCAEESELPDGTETFVAIRADWNGQHRHIDLCQGCWRPVYALMMGTAGRG